MTPDRNGGAAHVPPGSDAAGETRGNGTSLASPRNPAAGGGKTGGGGGKGRRRRVPDTWPEPAPRKRRDPYAAPRRSARLYLRADPAHIALLRFLLEAHGHLGVLSTLDSHRAVLCIVHSPESATEMREFLEEARELVPFEVIPRPGR
ncbi:hypothetical protein NNJEOMEG_00487 [Fundidesulfovibrio magnetotacticus]|uniref:DUF4911 domain-containing protein n=1 Tax=Fundidesulfovibrio magnetotacticus TaxID=2730080 RepID=A0A6V8LIT9_9BACT|nr:DUF4911 domain-containing protein [Fundidesulfovibrio magnetotacticus]GFK92662.1 hypothetical protein NNJEOMEG_00487 [Fundidesulfovibrio magnetotacticus]